MEIKELTKQKGYYIAIAASYVAALLFLIFGVGTGIFHVLHFADTYWIYYTFENPMSKNFSLKNSHKE